MKDLRTSDPSGATPAQHAVAARRVLAGLEGTDEDRAAIAQAARDDVVVFLRTAMWSRRIKRVIPETGEVVPQPGDMRIVPFDPWPRQVDLARRLVRSVEQGEDLAIAKSRETGVSTLVCGTIWWGWAFHGWDALLLSRVEEDVDKSGNPDTLFAKLDAITANVPSPLLPAGGSRADLLPGGARRMHRILVHPSGANAITGEATSGHAGRGGRKAVAVFDEAAAQDRFIAGWRSASDTVLAKWAVSTHLIGSYFTGQLWPTAQATGKPAALQITYADDPDKGAHAEVRVDVDGTVTGDVGREYVWTPWFERERQSRDLHDLRENVLGLPGTSGRSFFAPAGLANMRRLVSPPRRCETDRGVLHDSPAGRWYVFREPTPRDLVVLACDPSYGTGAANGVIAAMDADRRELLALFVDPACPPYDLSRTMVEAARGWARGRRDPMIGWETNGPGASMHHDLERLHYQVLYRQRQTGTTVEQRTRRLGWTSSRPAKRQMLGDLNRAMLEATVRIPCQQTIGELEATVVYADGGIGPAHLEQDASSGAREAHGDRVVAVGLALLLCDEVAGAPARDEAEGLPDWSAAAVLGMEQTPDGGWIPT